MFGERVGPQSISHPLEQVVPRAFQGEAQPGRHIDAGLFLACFERLEVAVRDVGLLRERFLGHTPLHAQTHEIACEQGMRASGIDGHAASMTARAATACDL